MKRHIPSEPQVIAVEDVANALDLFPPETPAKPAAPIRPRTPIAFKPIEQPEPGRLAEAPVSDPWQVRRRRRVTPRRVAWGLTATYVVAMGGFLAFQGNATSIWDSLVSRSAQAVTWAPNAPAVDPAIERALARPPAPPREIVGLDIGLAAALQVGQIVPVVATMGTVPASAAAAAKVSKRTTKPSRARTKTRPAVVATADAPAAPTSPAADAPPVQTRALLEPTNPQ